MRNLPLDKTNLTPVPDSSVVNPPLSTARTESQMQGISGASSLAVTDPNDPRYVDPLTTGAGAPLETAADVALRQQQQEAQVDILREQQQLT